MLIFNSLLHSIPDSSEKDTNPDQLLAFGQS